MAQRRRHRHLDGRRRRIQLLEALTASHEHLGPKEARREGPTGMALTVTRYRVGVQAPAIS
jgi:hypothetical protein